jgi:hypothetical protein
MELEVLENQEERDEWRVRLFDREGACLTARFTGKDAQQAARAYASWKSEDDRLMALQAVLFSLQIP